jgi:NADH dehydrogenase (ubiquinone) 1 alpha subcomplex subunit 9
MSGVAVPMSSTKLKTGRSGVSGITATVFGATGFLGKYVVNRFGKIGTRVILPHRGDDGDITKLKLAGDLGVVNPIESTIRSLADIEAAVAESNVVINLVGKHFETMRWSFGDVNTTFPAVLAQVCADVGVERFVHLSAMGAYVDSPSSWLRSKALGEEAVREAFPGATIIRPSTVFGDEDRFLNRIAKISQLIPFYPVSTEAQTARVQPVYMDDVAKAVFDVATSSAHMGKTYELAGPKVYTNKELIDYVFRIIKEVCTHHDHSPRPTAAASSARTPPSERGWVALLPAARGCPRPAAARPSRASVAGGALRWRSRAGAGARRAAADRLIRTCAACPTLRTRAARCGARRSDCSARVRRVAPRGGPTLTRVRGSLRRACTGQQLRLLVARDGTHRRHGRSADTQPVDDRGRVPANVRRLVHARGCRWLR